MINSKKAYSACLIILALSMIGTINYFNNLSANHELVRKNALFLLLPQFLLFLGILVRLGRLLNKERIKKEVNAIDSFLDKPVTDDEYMQFETSDPFGLIIRYIIFVFVLFFGMNYVWLFCFKAETKYDRLLLLAGWNILMSTEIYCTIRRVFYYFNGGALTIELGKKHIVFHTKRDGTSEYRISDIVSVKAIRFKSYHPYPIIIRMKDSREFRIDKENFQPFFQALKKRNPGIDIAANLL
jgi:hypothetical protein